MEILLSLLTTVFNQGSIQASGIDITRLYTMRNEICSGK
jgi:hypothetical protein